jgi:hypothetical protein
MNKYEIGNMYVFAKKGHENYLLIWASDITSYPDNSIDKGINQERLRYYET